MNQWRSPTAEQLYARDARINVRSRGTSQKARRTLTQADLSWADVIFAMEDCHRQRIEQQFPDQRTCGTIYVLDIPDEYRLMDPELVGCIRDSVESFLDDAEAG